MFANVKTVEKCIFKNFINFAIICSRFIRQLGLCETDDSVFEVLGDLIFCTSKSLFYDRMLSWI